MPTDDTHCDPECDTQRLRDTLATLRAERDALAVALQRLWARMEQFYDPHISFRRDIEGALAAPGAARVLRELELLRQLETEVARRSRTTRIRIDDILAALVALRKESTND